jgi:tyrosine-protein phosphatase SIW14
MPQPVRYLFGTLIAGLIVGGPLGYAHYRQVELRNFRVVREGVLYRGGQMRLDGVKRLIHDYGIKTVVTLRDAATPGEAPPDLAEEKYCKAQEINHYRLPPRNWSSPVGTVPAEENVRKFLEIMDNPENYPVLVHCCAGSHRTGAYCAIYRMEYEHWTNAEALDEMKACGYSNLDDEWDILGYLEQYQPRWKKAQATGNEPPAAADGR